MNPLAEKAETIYEAAPPMHDLALEAGVRPASNPGDEARGLIDSAFDENIDGMPLSASLETTVAEEPPVYEGPRSYDFTTKIKGLAQKALSASEVAFQGERRRRKGLNLPSLPLASLLRVLNGFGLEQTNGDKNDKHVRLYSRNTGGTISLPKGNIEPNRLIQMAFRLRIPLKAMLARLNT